MAGDKTSVGTADAGVATAGGATGVAALGAGSAGEGGTAGNAGNPAGEAVVVDAAVDVGTPEDAAGKPKQPTDVAAERGDGAVARAAAGKVSIASTSPCSRFTRLGTTRDALVGELVELIVAAARQQKCKRRPKESAIRYETRSSIEDFLRPNVSPNHHASSRISVLRNAVITGLSRVGGYP